MTRHELRPYQKQVADRSVAFLTQKRPENGIVVVPTGGGKAHIIADIVSRLPGPALVFQPSREILAQNFEKLVLAGASPAIYSASAGQKRIGQRITLATIGSVVNHPDKFGHVQFILIDECFVAGTLVDGRPIESISPGQLVTAYDHDRQRLTMRRVLAVSRRAAPRELYCVKLPGVSILTTCNHPFFVKGRGYTAARLINPGDILYERSPKPSANIALPCLSSPRGDYRYGALPEMPKEELESESWRMPVFRAGQGILFENAKEKSNEVCCHSRKDGSVVAPDRSQASDSWGQWMPNAETSTDSTFGSWRGLVWRGESPTPKGSEKRLSDCLQDRRSKSVFENCRRSGWQQSFFEEASRREENCILRECRVDSVEIQKPDSLGRYKDGRRHDFVFNLEVEGLNNYFAEGVLVHNCHLVGAKNEDSMFMKFLAKFPKIRVLGLTATPYRLASNSWGSELRFITRTRPRVFTRVVDVVQNADLFRDGYLARLEYKVVKSGFRADRLRLNSTGADYTDDSVRAHFQELNFPDQIVRCVRRLAEIGRHGTLVFTRFVEEAHYVARHCYGAVVSANTPPNERREIIEGFKAGRIKTVCNVNVLSVGFDFPALANVVIAAPTMSLARWYQQVGRVIRPHPSKASAFVVDMVGLVERFGRVEDLVITCGEREKWQVESLGRPLTNVYFGDAPNKWVMQAKASPLRAVPGRGPVMAGSQV